MTYNYHSLRRLLDLVNHKYDCFYVHWFILYSLQLLSFPSLDHQSCTTSHHQNGYVCVHDRELLVFSSSLRNQMYVHVFGTVNFHHGWFLRPFLAASLLSVGSLCYGLDLSWMRQLCHFFLLSRDGHLWPVSGFWFSFSVLLRKLALLSKWRILSLQHHIQWHVHQAYNT